MPARSPRPLREPLSIGVWRYRRPDGRPGWGSTHLVEADGVLACRRSPDPSLVRRPLLGPADAPLCADCRSVAGLPAPRAYPTWTFWPDQRGSLYHLREQGRRAVLCGATGRPSGAPGGWCEPCATLGHTLAASAPPVRR